MISGMTMTPERNATYMFVGPYMISGQAILARREAAQRLSEPDDLNHPEVTIAAAAGTTNIAAVRDLLPQAKVLEVLDQEQGLRAMLEGKAQVLVAEHSFCVVAALRYGEQGLTNWLENFLFMLKGTGRMEMLGQRWFKDAGWLKEIEANRLL